jgi:F-type H+-transporting ATPase subunit alpha
VSLNQGERQPLAVEDQVLQVYAATNGFLDRIKVERVPEFLAESRRARARSPQGAAQEDRRQDWSDEVQDAVREAATEFAEDFGYDLDEDGQPIDEDARCRRGAAEPQKRAQRKKKEEVAPA